MNVNIKIAAGIAAGLIAGATVMGAAFAAPRVRSGQGLGYGMMGSATANGTFERPSVAEMQDFMQQYRTSNGGIDMNRMHADVTSGKVTPPCLDGAGGRGTGGTPGQGRGYGMMGRRF